LFEFGELIQEAVVDARRTGIKHALTTFRDSKISASRGL
jgi:hypothetical protein